MMRIAFSNGQFFSTSERVHRLNETEIIFLDFPTSCSKDENRRKLRTKHASRTKLGAFKQSFFRSIEHNSIDFILHFMMESWRGIGYDENVLQGPVSEAERANCMLTS